MISQLHPVLGFRAPLWGIAISTFVTVVFLSGESSASPSVRNPAEIIASRGNSNEAFSKALNALAKQNDDVFGDAIRKAVENAERALEQGEALLKANPTDELIAIQVAELLNQLGFFYSNRATDGDLSKSIAHLTRRLGIIEKILAQNPGNLAIAWDVAMSLEWLSDLLLDREQAGDEEKAFAYDQRCLALRERALEANPHSDELKRDISVSLGKLGASLSRRGKPSDPDGALDYLTRSLELSQSLLKAEPESQVRKRDVAVGMEWLGDLLKRRPLLDKNDAAFRFYTRSLELKEQILTENPDDPETRRDVSVGLEKLSVFLFIRATDGDFELSLRQAIRCLSMRELLLKETPDSARAKRGVSTIAENLGRLYFERKQPGDVESALSLFARAVALSESLLKSDPSDIEAASDLGLALSRHANALAARGNPGDFEAALGHYDRSLELHQQLSCDYPDSDSNLQNVSISLVEIGDLFSERSLPGDTDAALGYYTRALEISEARLKTDPNSFSAMRDVALDLERLGAAFSNRGDGEAAIQNFTRGHELREAIVKALPDSLAAMKEAMYSSTQLGQALGSRGQPNDIDAGIIHLTRHVALSAMVLKIVPRFDNQERMLRGIQTLNGLLIKRGTPADIESFFLNMVQSLEMYEKRLKENPDSLQAKSDASVMLFNVGTLLGERHNWDSALDHYTRSLELREAMLSSSPQSAEYVEAVVAVMGKITAALVERGHPAGIDKAVNHGIRSFSLIESRLNEAPDSPGAKRNLWSIAISVGDLLLKRAGPLDLDKALICYSRSLDVGEELLKESPNSTQAMLDLSISLEKLSEHGGLELDANVGCASRCFELRNTALTSDPTSTATMQTVIAALTRLGDLVLKRNRPTEVNHVFEYFTRAVELNETLRQAGPPSDEAIDDAASLQNRLGFLLAARAQDGDSDQSFAHHTRSLQLRESILKANPTSAEVKRALTLSLNNLADFLRKRARADDLDRALELYTRSLDLRESAFTANPTSLKAATDVVVTRVKIASLLRQNGDTDGEMQCNRSLYSIIKSAMGRGVIFDSEIKSHFEELKSQFDSQ
jgi:tetratricopeptide (TPR) repeat protein